MQRTLVAMLAAGAALAAGASNRGEEKRDVSSQKRGAEPRKRAHAQAKVTVHDSSATPYDQAGGPPLAEVHIRESFRETSRANRRSAPSRSAATTGSRASSACSDSDAGSAAAR